MASGGLVPVIVGVGDYRNRSQDPEDAVEPLHLIITALKAAVQDTRAPASIQKELLAKADSFDAVRGWTWPYDNLAASVAEEVHARPNHAFTTPRHGGDAPCLLIDDAARRISQGKSDIAIVTGAESLASLSAYTAAKGELPAHWTQTKDSLESIWANETNKRNQPIGSNLGISAPIQVYPLYENAFRAKRKQTVRENSQESARMYGDFARTAEKNPYAWNFGRKAQTEDAIGTVSKKNRMICFPYPLLMNAFNNVNLAAACILTSTKQARTLGIPESQWIYPLGGAGTTDSSDFLYRPTFTESPCITASLYAALQVCNLEHTAIDAFDFYSCFPIVPKLACAAMRLPIDPPYSKPISLLGGLTSFGGAGNNYSMHALTAMVRYLRDRSNQAQPTHGLVLANGGVASYQYVVCLSTRPRADKSPYPASNPLPPQLPMLSDSEIELQADGEAVIETYTVDFERNGKPSTGYVIGRVSESGKRFIAMHGDERTLMELASTMKEPIGRKGRVQADDSGNIFFLHQGPSI